MINPNTLFGRAVLVFFWGGLAANIVTFIWSFWHFDPILIGWFVVLVNIGLVTLKNILIPPKKG